MTSSTTLSSACIFSCSAPSGAPLFLCQDSFGLLTPSPSLYYLFLFLFILLPSALRPGLISSALLTACITLNTLPLLRVSIATVTCPTAVQNQRDHVRGGVSSLPARGSISARPSFFYYQQNKFHMLHLGFGKFVYCITSFNETVVSSGCFLIDTKP